MTNVELLAKQIKDGINEYYDWYLLHGGRQQLEKLEIKSKERDANLVEIKEFMHLKNKIDFESFKELITFTAKIAWGNDTTVIFKEDGLIVKLFNNEVFIKYVGAK